ncbi:MAG: hypothetical protein ACRDR6_10795 [Pseudonocardiaceae bacterium]
MTIAFTIVMLLFTIALVTVAVRLDVLLSEVRQMRERVDQLWAWSGKNYSKGEPLTIGDIGSTNFSGAIGPRSVKE